MRNLHLSIGQYPSSGANAQKRFEQNLSSELSSIVSLRKSPRVGTAQPFAEAQQSSDTNTGAKRKQFSTKERALWRKEP